MLQVGQKLWFVPSQYSSSREPYEIEIVKIGRKWIAVGQGWREYRIDINTMAADGKGCMSPGRCYLSKEAYESEQLRQKAWDNLVKALTYMPPDITISDIQQAVQLLRLSPKDTTIR